MPSRESPFLAGLNPPQREAVRHTEGPLLVLAGAGSGKTRVITRRIAYLIGEGIAPANRILAVTFTNKAAEEMRLRAGELVGAEIAKNVTLTTFHSFCARVLRAHIERIGYRKNFTISDEGDTRTLLRRVLGDIEGPTESFSPQLLLAEISLHKNAGEPEPAPPPEKKRARKKPQLEKDPIEENKEKYRVWLPEVYERYQSALRAANAVDFDDLLVLTLKLWREHPAILRRFQDHYRYVMVDEYQDTNQVQYELLRALVERHDNLGVVGDDDQSIYGWRGADMRKILGFDRDFPNAKIVTLDQNYRSTETILEAANAVIAHNEHRRAKNLWSALGKGRPLEWIVTGDDEHEAKTALSWLEHIRQRARAKFADFAILYRSSIQSRPFELAFRQAGVPYAVFGGQDFFERTEVKDIVAYLKLIVNPHDEASFLRIVNMPRRGIGDAALHKIHALCIEQSLTFGKAMAEALARDLVAGPAAQGMRQFLGLVSEFRRRFRERGQPYKHVVADLIERIGYRDELLRSTKTPEQFEQRWGNVEAVVSAVAAYEAETAAPSLSEFLDANALNTDDDRRAKQERREDAVSLMTIHSAKGLEFPFVFIVGCEEGLLPHERSLRDNALEEERRLFYVALTRGRRHVTLFETLSRNRHGREHMTQPSRFLKEIPDALLHQSLRAARDMVQDRTAPDPPKKPARKKKFRKK